MRLMSGPGSSSIRPGSARACRLRPGPESVIPGRSRSKNSDHGMIPESCRELPSSSWADSDRGDRRCPPAGGPGPAGPRAGPGPDALGGSGPTRAGVAPGVSYYHGETVTAGPSGWLAGCGPGAGLCTAPEAARAAAAF
jgi:hypothetical protein